MPNPYDKTTHDGKAVDWLTHCVLLEMELRLGYRLSLYQGSYHGGTTASAGTHDGGGAFDLLPWDWKNKVRVGRQVGVAIWHRLPSEGKWVEHCHGIVIGNTKLSKDARDQVTDYFNGRNGLKNNRVDTFGRPDPIPTYKWPGSAGALALEAKAKQVLDKKAAPRPTTTAPASGAQRIDLTDLSHHNTVTLAGLNQAKAAGLKGIYHKATEGGTIKDAAYGVRRAMNSKGPKLRWGAYHFARPDKDGKDAVAEANFFLKVAGVNPGNLPPMLDLEDTGGLTPAALDTWVNTWCDTVERATGVRPIVYLRQDIDLKTRQGLLWVPRYSDAMRAPRVNAPWDDWDIWQFSNGVYGHPDTLPGLGHVDLNVVKGGSNVLATWKVPTKKTPTTPKPKPTPVTSFVQVDVNVQYTDKTVDTDGLIAKTFAGRPDIVSWQEIEEDNLVASLRAAKGYSTYLPSNPKPGGKPTAADYNAVSWNTATFEFISGSSIFVHSGQAGVTPSRYITVVRLRQIVGGHLVTVINTGVVHHIEAGGKAMVYKGAEVKEFADQQARAKKHFALLRDTIVAESKKAPVIWSGDFNVAYTAEKKLSAAKRVPYFPLTVLSPVTTFEMAGPTHGKRDIDWGGHTGKIACTNTEVLAQTTSDHRATRRTYNLAA